MTQLDDLIDFLGRFKGGSGATKDSIAPEQIASHLEDERPTLIMGILTSVGTSLSNAYEVKNYPEIASHLIEILGLKLRSNDREFLKITGLRFNSYSTKLEVVAPNLESLGSYSDWLAMQTAGQNLFPAKDSPNPAAGWRGYYTSYLNNSGKNDVYPAVMRVRLAWAKGNELAPYWYWYDQSVSTTAAYPHQEVINFSAEITYLAEVLAKKINDAVVKVDFGYRGTIDWEETERAIEDELARALGGPPPVKRTLITFVYTGRFHKQTISQATIQAKLASGDLKESSSFQRGSKTVVNLYDAATGYLTGLSRELKNL